MRRREFIGAAGAATGATLAGCLGGGGGGSGGAGLSDHPAARAIAAQPVLGPDPGSSPAVIVGFEDPSCPSCRRFELGAFQKIRSELTDAGEASFVYRNIPVVYPWGEPASRALESVHARDPAAFWGLKDFYYRAQSQFTTDVVYPRTRSYLSENTGLDAEAVVRAARQGDHDGAIRTDLAAAEDAGVQGTPTFFLFRDGEFATSLVGPKSYDAFRSSLGL